MSEPPHPSPLPAERGEGTRRPQRWGPIIRIAPWSFGSGAAVATVFARGLALVSLIAWVSLGVQVQVLIGSRGLLPAADFIAAARAQPGVSLSDLPTLAW